MKIKIFLGTTLIISSIFIGQIYGNIAKAQTNGNINIPLNISIPSNLTTNVILRLTNSYNKEGRIKPDSLTINQWLKKELGNDVKTNIKNRILTEKRHEEILLFQQNMKIDIIDLNTITTG